MQRKTWYSILGLDAMPLFLKNLLLNSKLTLFQLQDMIMLYFFVSENWKTRGQVKEKNMQSMRRNK